VGAKRSGCCAPAGVQGAEPPEAGVLTHYL